VVVASDRYAALEGIPDPDVTIGGQSDVTLGWAEIMPEVPDRALMHAAYSSRARPVTNCKR
jgi:hypothetical protein